MVLKYHTSNSNTLYNFEIFEIIRNKILLGNYLKLTASIFIYPYYLYQSLLVAIIVLIIRPNGFEPVNTCINCIETVYSI